MEPSLLGLTRNVITPSSSRDFNHLGGSVGGGARRPKPARTRAAPDGSALAALPRYASARRSAARQRREGERGEATRVLAALRSPRVASPRSPNSPIA